MSNPKKRVAFAMALLLAGLLSGCSTGTALAPTDGSNQVEETESAEPPMDERTHEESPTPSKTEKEFPFSQVQARNSRDNCWIVVLGNVYDFTTFVQQHPFGDQLTNAVCGQDATETFQENADLEELVKRLEPLYLGPVVIG